MDWREHFERREFIRESIPPPDNVFQQGDVPLILPRNRGREQSIGSSGVNDGDHRRSMEEEEEDGRESAPPSNNTVIGAAQGRRAGTVESTASQARRLATPLIPNTHRTGSQPILSPRRERSQPFLIQPVPEAGTRESREGLTLGVPGRPNTDASLRRHSSNASNSPYRRAYMERASVERPTGWQSTLSPRRGRSRPLWIEPLQATHTQASTQRQHSARDLPRESSASGAGLLQHAALEGARQYGPQMNSPISPQEIGRARPRSPSPMEWHATAGPSSQPL